MENNGNEREQGLMGRENIFFSFPFRFLLFVALLDNHLKYPENHRERLSVDEADKLHPDNVI